MQPPPSAPPQWSADGQWWWDGSQWMPRNQMVAPGYAMPPPTFQMPPPIVLTPSPGLRIVLLVMLSLNALIAGFFSLFGVLGVAGGANTGADIVLAALFVVLFAVTMLALVGVAMRASWSRWAAIAAGIAVSLTCLGLVLGIPILVTAARAPDLKRFS